MNTKVYDDRPYEVRRDERIAAHAAKLTSAEATAVAAVREYLKLKLRGPNLRYALNVHTEGLVNANDTVFAEKAQPREQWLYMFTASMGCLLVSASRVDLQGVNNKRVLEVFAAIKVRG